MVLFLSLGFFALGSASVTRLAVNVFFFFVFRGYGDFGANRNVDAGCFLAWFKETSFVAARCRCRETALKWGTVFRGRSVRPTCFTEVL